jgi:hypothetical protein
MIKPFLKSTFEITKHKNTESMKKNKKIILFIVSGILSFSACKKDDKGDILYGTNGSVSGTIKGTKTDNSVLDEQFSFNQYLDLLDDQSLTITPQDGYTFSINYSNPDNSGISLTFALDNASDNTPTITDFSIRYYKVLNSTSVLYYNMGTFNNSITYSDFSYDPASGRVKIKVTITGTNNSTGKNATVVASFDVTVKRIEY